MASSKNRFEPLDASAMLRVESAAPLTVTADGTYFDLASSTAEWNLGQTGSKMQFVVLAQVTAADVSGTGTYALALKVSNADSTVTKTFSSTVVTGTGLVVLPILVEQIESVAGASKITVTATLGGTTPSFDYYAWVSVLTGH